jgi:small-conductance mechanosensitive channel
MDLSAIWNWIRNDERLLAHGIGLAVIVGGLIFFAVLIHQVFKHGVYRFVCWTELPWLHACHEQAHRGLRRILFWLTLGLMVATIVAMGVYHFAGQDIRTDLRDWFGRLTGSQILAFGVTLGKIVVIAVLAGVAFRLMGRLSTALEKLVMQYLPRSLPAESADVSPSEWHHPEHRVQYEATARRWCHMLERFGKLTVLLGAVWLVGRLAALPRVDTFAALLLRILTIITLARLLTLSCRTISCGLATLGDRHLGRGKFHRYWERVTRLIPFGERCFEAAVYITAASMCVRELEFIAFVAAYGTMIVKCIGIFFGTRVVIELLYVFINEAFGMYHEHRPLDQKGQTLVPLMHSLCQYTLYFGSVLFMLGVFEIDTTPILAGAGILGLAGGLGAQSLVTDVVSGFFILFENWYLVGDIVQIGDAVGRVEAVSIRHTQLRDEQGKLFIIPNGQIKTVTNFSKGYVNAVVDIKVPASTNLEKVMRDMAEAGRRLRLNRSEVLADTVVKGLVELTPSDMVIRAVTRVQPGTHLAMQQEYRRLLKAVFDEETPPEVPALAA